MFATGKNLRHGQFGIIFNPKFDQLRLIRVASDAYRSGPWEAYGGGEGGGGEELFNDEKCLV